MRASPLSLLALAVSGTVSSAFGDKARPAETYQVVETRGGTDPVSVGVNTEEFNDFTRFAQYAGAAYCDAVAGGPVYCKGDICPAGNSNATIYSVFHGTQTDISGFVAVDITAQEIIISVRGTSSMYNWLADVVWARQRLGGEGGCGDNCWAHMGFLFAYGEIVRSVMASLASATRAFPSYKISVAGHSLGGAVGALLAMRLREVGYALDLYTYGAPRVGNEALSQYISHGQQTSTGASSGQTYRITHWRDLVPRLPPLNREFRHMSPEYWLQPGSSMRAATYTAADIDVCRGPANAACNAATPWWIMDITSHLYYFVPISHCGEAEPRLRLGPGVGGGVRTGAGAGGGPFNGTTVANGSGAAAGLDQATAERLGMYAKLDQEYAEALDSGFEREVVF